MTTSPNPNNADEARDLVALPVPTTQEAEAALVVAKAQVHATLALEAQTARLADEQRTANLIALYELGGETSVFAGLNYSALFDQILARLDLTQDVTP